MHPNGGKSPPAWVKECMKKTQPMMLIHEIARLMGDKIREKGEANPIGQRSGRLIMMELSAEDGRTQLDLVKATHLKAPTVSVALQKLEMDGYVMRETDERDMRAMRVYLTEKGRALEERLHKRIIEEEAAATAVLTEAECETLCALLGKLRQSLLPEETTESYIEKENNCEE